MKISGVIPYFLLFILAILTLYKTSQQSKQIDNLKRNVETLQSVQPTVPEPQHFELATAMGKLQYFVNKLYFSYKNSNKPLADFYLHELEEAFEEIEEANVMDDGIHISDNIKTFGISGINNFERFMEDNPTMFEEHYQGLINACNACHIASKHPFINITVPTIPVSSNQEFKTLR